MAIQHMWTGTTGSALVLRTATADEASRMVTTYSRWNDRDLLPRSEAELRAAAANGMLFVVESRDTGRVVAASGVFQVRADECVEGGATYVEAAFRGLRLQRVFVALRVAAVVVQHGAHVRFTTAIDPGNEHSRRNADRAGFVAMLEPLPEHLAACGTCPKRASIAPPRSCCCDFYELPAAQRRQAVYGLLRQIDRDAVLSRHDGVRRPLLIHESCRAIAAVDARLALREFAIGLERRRRST